jgi:hypothetical protein
VFDLACDTGAEHGAARLALRAVHFSLDSAQASKLRQRWLAAGLAIPLELADCPDRQLGHAAAELAAAEAAAPGTHVTVVLPRRSYPPLAGRLLHDHTADRIARRVSRVRGAAATIIPFDVRHKVETIHARRTRAAAHREPDPPAGADPIGRCASRAGPPSRAGCRRRRSARAGTPAMCWRAKSPTRPAS